ncbi:hypothetical protein KL86APRO_10365 [uncultured Alphaproteobacteria bacterium]|uniref:Uncharacterized protein n=1 Tax=uncultured Alphaproteobacteria bacterium TaxID=91750 RepID=A0A212J1I6_9PROT|nr:hypothetical protein KL86APRO_10365 [uncultured Alphaproteobacteria bacterium]
MRPHSNQILNALLPSLQKNNLSSPQPPLIIRIIILTSNRIHIVISINLSKPKLFPFWGCQKCIFDIKFRRNICRLK